MNSNLTVVLVILGAIGLYQVLSLLMTFGSIVKKAWKEGQKYREMEKKKKELLKNGEMHVWTEVTAPDGLSKITVCEKTGWCPSRKSFLSLTAIEGLKAADKIEQEYSDFKKQKMEEIAAKNNMTVDNLESIYTDLLMIKKDFYLVRINSFLKELKERKNA